LDRDEVKFACPKCGHLKIGLFYAPAFEDFRCGDVQSSNASREDHYRNTPCPECGNSFFVRESEVENFDKAVLEYGPADFFAELKKGAERWLEFRYKYDMLRITLMGQDLREVNIKNANLWGVDCRHAIFDGLDLRSLFKKPDMGWFPFHPWRNVGDNISKQFEGASMRDVNISGCDLYAVSFQGADLKGANFSNSTLGLIDFTGACLDQANLADIKLVYIESYCLGNLNESMAEEDALSPTRRTLTFMQVSLFEADLSGIDLDLVLLRNSYCQRANFSRAICRYNRYEICENDFRQSLWREATLNGVSFPGSNLKGADFSQAQLAGADFSRSNLASACFDEANLRNADFTGADLRTSSFVEADVAGSNLVENPHAEVIDLSQAFNCTIKAGEQTEETIYARGWNDGDCQTIKRQILHFATGTRFSTKFVRAIDKVQSEINTKLGACMRIRQYDLMDDFVMLYFSIKNNASSANSRRSRPPIPFDSGH